MAVPVAGVCNMSRPWRMVSLTPFLTDWRPRVLPNIWKFNVEFDSNIYPHICRVKDPMARVYCLSFSNYFDMSKPK